jgi:hypothetical protein
MRDCHYGLEGSGADITCCVNSWSTGDCSVGKFWQAQGILATHSVSTVGPKNMECIYTAKRPAQIEDLGRASMLIRLILIKEVDLNVK